MEASKASSPATGSPDTDPDRGAGRLPLRLAYGLSLPRLPPNSLDQQSRDTIVSRIAMSCSGLSMCRNASSMTSSASDSLPRSARSRARDSLSSSKEFARAQQRTPLASRGRIVVVNQGTVVA
jgi:hypothetical protein